jgi:hypothetical protein
MWLSGVKQRKHVIEGLTRQRCWECHPAWFVAQDVSASALRPVSLQVFSETLDRDSFWFLWTQVSLCLSQFSFPLYYFFLILVLFSACIPPLAAWVWGMTSLMSRSKFSVFRFLRAFLPLANEGAAPRKWSRWTRHKREVLIPHKYP